MEDKSKVIFGNEISDKDYKKALKSKKKYAKKFGDDSNVDYPVHIQKNPYIGDSLAVDNILVGNPTDNIHYTEGLDVADGAEAFDTEKGIIVGNIRMGFGHYRISMAMASAAKALGYKPYWLDLNSFPKTTCTKVGGRGALPGSPTPPTILQPMGEHMAQQGASGSWRHALIGQACLLNILNITP